MLNIHFLIKIIKTTALPSYARSRACSKAPIVYSNNGHIQNDLKIKKSYILIYIYTSHGASAIHTDTPYSGAKNNFSKILLRNYKRKVNVILWFITINNIQNLLTLD